MNVAPIWALYASICNYIPPHGHLFFLRFLLCPAPVFKTTYIVDDAGVHTDTDADLTQNHAAFFLNPIYVGKSISRSNFKPQSLISDGQPTAKTSLVVENCPPQSFLQSPVKVGWIRLFGHNPMPEPLQQNA